MNLLLIFLKKRLLKLIPDKYINIFLYMIIADKNFDKMKIKTPKANYSETIL